MSEQREREREREKEKVREEERGQDRFLFPKTMIHLHIARAVRTSDARQDTVVVRLEPLLHVAPIAELRSLAQKLEAAAFFNEFFDSHATHQGGLLDRCCHPLHICDFKFDLKEVVPFEMRRCKIMFRINKKSQNAHQL